MLNFSLRARRTEWRVWDRMFPTGLAGSPQTVDEIRRAQETIATAENQLSDQLSYFAVLIERGSILFRARPGCEASRGVSVPHKDVGPNPSHPASRANTEGQYSVYTAEAEMTAVAETKQPPGSALSIGEFVVGPDITVIDLCTSFGTPNPFVTKNLPLQLDVGRLLSGIAGTMSKPTESQAEYRSTQLLANIVRAVGYDGIRYPSAVKSGSPNVVLFRPDALSKRASWVNALTDRGAERV